MAATSAVVWGELTPLAKEMENSLSDHPEAVYSQAEKLEESAKQIISHLVTTEDIQTIVTPIVVILGRCISSEMSQHEDVKKPIVKVYMLFLEIMWFQTWAKRKIATLDKTIQAIRTVCSEILPQIRHNYPKDYELHYRLDCIAQTPGLLRPTKKIWKKYILSVGESVGALVTLGFTSLKDSIFTVYSQVSGDMTSKSYLSQWEIRWIAHSVRTTEEFDLTLQPMIDQLWNKSQSHSIAIASMLFGITSNKYLNQGLRVRALFGDGKAHGLAHHCLLEKHKPKIDLLLAWPQKILSNEWKDYLEMGRGYRRANTRRLAGRYIAKLCSIDSLREYRPKMIRFLACRVQSIRDRIASTYVGELEDFEQHIEEAKRSIEKAEDSLRDKILLEIDKVREICLRALVVLQESTNLCELLVSLLENKLNDAKKIIDTLLKNLEVCRTLEKKRTNTPFLSIREELSERLEKRRSNQGNLLNCLICCSKAISEYLQQILVEEAKRLSEELTTQGKELCEEKIDREVTFETAMLKVMGPESVGMSEYIKRGILGVEELIRLDYKHQQEMKEILHEVEVQRKSSFEALRTLKQAEISYISECKNIKQHLEEIGDSEFSGELQQIFIACYQRLDNSVRSAREWIRNGNYNPIEQLQRIGANLPVEYKAIVDEMGAIQSDLCPSVQTDQEYIARIHRRSQLDLQKLENGVIRASRVMSRGVEPELMNQLSLSLDSDGQLRVLPRPLHHGAHADVLDLCDQTGEVSDSEESTLSSSSKIFVNAETGDMIASACISSRWDTECAGV